MNSIPKDWKMLETKAFNTINSCLMRCYKNNFLMAVVGEQGSGKSSTFRLFKEKHTNIYIITLNKTWRPKDLYLEILNCLQIHNYTIKDTLPAMYARITLELSNRKDKILFIFDEAGKFSADMLEYFQPMRDATSENVGMILSGTSQFKTQFDKWVTQKKLGIPELGSRIYKWIEIPKTDYNEKCQILTANGIKEPKIIKQIAQSSIDLRQLYQNASLYKNELDEASKEVTEPQIEDAVTI
jgi:hypothetical protein